MKLLLPIIIFVLPLTISCVSVGTKFDEAEARKISRCKTTKTELMSKFGTPYKEGVQSGYNTMTWFYGQASVGKSDGQGLIVFLNASNVVVDYALNPVGLVEVKDACK